MSIKINGYTDGDIRYIVENYTKYTNKEMADHLGKSENSIGYVRRKLNLIKQPHKPWSLEEEDYLRNNYLKMSSDEIANELKRTVHSINAKCADLNLIKHEAWSDEEIDYLINHYIEMDHDEIGRNIGRSEGAVRAKCFELDLYKKESPWSDDEIEFLKNNYMQMSKNEISEILNRSPSAISLKASRLGLKKYPYYCDYHYFDEIDTEERAYWLGFIVADGWMSRNDKTNSGAIGIELQYSDIGHLKKFNKSIGGNYNITDRWKKCKILTNPEKLNHMCIIRIFSIIMYESLFRLGLTSEKTYTAKIPEIRDDLYRHFLRGFFDGDGCLSVSNTRLSVSFCTVSESLKNDIIKLVKNNGIDIKDYHYLCENGTIMYRPEVTEIKEKIKFLDFIYKDASIYLDRKYKKYLKVKEKYNSSDGLAA